MGLSPLPEGVQPLGQGLRTRSTKEAAAVKLGAVASLAILGWKCPRAGHDYWYAGQPRSPP